MIIQPIVEGQGEVAAVPLLLRRLQEEAQCWGLGVGKPHRKRRRMPKSASYSATVDQAALTAHLDLETTYQRCRSFRKLVGAYGALAAAAGVAPPVWPPTAWVS